ncbi:MAG: aminodeoxychorismate synthase component I [Verrucomicrobiota bacterium]
MKSCAQENPLDLARRLAPRGRFVFLDSSREAYGMGRYSILGTSFLAEARYRGGVGTIVEGDEEKRFEEDPFAFLKRVMGLYSDFQEGGLIGYLAYDLGRYVEDLPSVAVSEGAYEMRYYAFERLAKYDNLEGRWLAEFDSESAECLLDRESRYEVGELESNFSKESFCASVERIRELIRMGDVYQVNLSQQFSAEFEGNTWELYERLREASPSQYGAYLDFGDEVILSSSPERFLKKEGFGLETRPIKGTRRRGRTEVEDAALLEDLRNSEKDRSELLMIVDLERNDLGRVCRPGSIEVPRLFELESYANVIHQTATVRGEVPPEAHAVDVIRAMFPGGSITGAPKIRAMEVIEELEPIRRGVYTGAIGVLGFDGDLDLNIAIRTMRIADGKIRFNVGGGIVWDSDPKSEYKETLDKAASIFKALGKAEDE